MTKHNEHSLGIERIINAPIAKIWDCWTQPELLMQWFCPKPWQVTQAELELKPGGKMNTVMQGPEGERFDNLGCFLEVIPNRKLVFTDTLTAGFVPSENPFMTAVVELTEQNNNHTMMKWYALHANQENKQKHLDMGFEAGWNTATDQLEALARTIAGS